RSSPAYLSSTEDDSRGGPRLAPPPDGPPDPRPGVRENAPILGNLAADFNFRQTPRPPVLLPTNPPTDSPTIPPYFTGKPPCYGCTRPPPARPTGPGGRVSQESGNGAPSPPTSTQPPRVAANDDSSWISQLQDLAQLHGQDVLSDAEDEAAKRRVLEQK